MKSLFNEETLKEVLIRINNLQPTSERQWGKMEVDQMLAHCTEALKVACGETFPPRIFIGRIVAPFIKSKYYDDSEIAKNIPTDKSFIIPEKKNFENEKATLKKYAEMFCNNGQEKCTNHPHPFFGSLSPQHWSIGMYKHLNHHLKQFGV